MEKKVKILALIAILLFINFSIKEKYDFYKAKKYFYRGEFKKALLIYTQYPELKKASAVLNFNIATVYLEMGKYDNAEKYFKSSLSLVNSSTLKKKIFFNLGYLFYLKGEKKKALNFFKKSAIIDSEDILCKRNIEILLKRETKNKNKRKMKTRNNDKKIRKKTDSRLLNYLKDAERISLKEFLNKKNKKIKSGEKDW